MLNNNLSYGTFTISLPATNCGLSRFAMTNCGHHYPCVGYSNI